MKENQEYHLSREIIFCLSGEHFYGFRDKIWRVVPGTIILIDQRDTHDASYSPFQPLCRDLWIHFLRPNFFVSNEAIINGAKVNEAGVSKADTQGLEDQENYQLPSVRPFAESINLAWNYCDKEPKNAFNLTQLKSTVTAMLLEVLLRGSKPCSTPEKVAHQKLVVEEIKTYIQSHLGANLSLNNLAKMAGYDPIYFHRLFTRFSGEPLHQFINTQRLEKAKEFLLQGQKIISIADALGFAHSSNFCRFFRKEAQLTPGAWLEKERNR
jgi:AraC-like DNA-binding protein